MHCNMVNEVPVAFSHHSNVRVLHDVIEHVPYGVLVLIVCTQVGCTNWKRVWMILTGLSNETDPTNIPEMLPHELHNSMMLVRQPYSVSLLLTCLTYHSPHISDNYICLLFTNNQQFSQSPSFPYTQLHMLSTKNIW